VRGGALAGRERKESIFEGKKTRIEGPRKGLTSAGHGEGADKRSGATGKGRGEIE